MEEALEAGFLKAPNRERLRFALMWANHDWYDWFPAPHDKPHNRLLPHRHSPADLLRVVDYCIDRYFRQPNYWRVADRLFSVFVPQHLIAQLGGPGQTRSLLESVDRKLERAGLPGIHWNAMIWNPSLAATFREAGFHSTTTYNITDAHKTAANFTRTTKT